MKITEMLTQTGGLQNMARELGVSENEVQSGAEELAPAILGGFEKHADKLGGGALLDDVVSTQPTNVSSGNNVLQHIFGSKDVSRSVAQNAAQRSGLDPSLLKRMLPMLAMMVTGYMAKQGGAAAAPLANILRGVRR